MSPLSCIDKLLAARPLSRRAVETALELPLREDVENTNPTLRVYRSFRGRAPIKKVELRVPLHHERIEGLPSSVRTDSFVLIELDESAELVAEESVVERFGALRDFGKARAGSPRWREARTIRGPVLFGYDPSAEGRLREIVVDAV
jgi:hypothetical protein